MRSWGYTVAAVVLSASYGAALSDAGPAGGAKDFGMVDLAPPPRLGRPVSASEAPAGRLAGNSSFLPAAADTPWLDLVSGTDLSGLEKVILEERSRAHASVRRLYAENALQEDRLKASRRVDEVDLRKAQLDSVRLRLAAFGPPREPLAWLEYDPDVLRARVLAIEIDPSFNAKDLVAGGQPTPAALRLRVSHLKLKATLDYVLRLQLDLLELVEFVRVVSNVRPTELGVGNSAGAGARPAARVPGSGIGGLEEAVEILQAKLAVRQARLDAALKRSEILGEIDKVLQQGAFSRLERLRSKLELEAASGVAQVRLFELNEAKTELLQAKKRLESLPEAGGGQLNPGGK